MFSFTCPCVEEGGPLRDLDNSQRLNATKKLRDRTMVQWSGGHGQPDIIGDITRLSELQLPGNNPAEHYDAARAALEKGDYETARRVLGESATKEAEEAAAAAAAERSRKRARAAVDDDGIPLEPALLPSAKRAKRNVDAELPDYLKRSSVTGHDSLAKKSDGIAGIARRSSWQRRRRRWKGGRGDESGRWRVDSRRRQRLG
eukprot:PLAT11626.19.p1 GENE.PLAT11626.19~~PLAT11626.19.p1  ORF type:complete len:202 (-),score=93.63 PLAT11626.19:357-962(-)